MQILLTTCQRHLPSDSIKKNYSLTINSVMVNGAKAHFEVLKKYNDPYNKNGDVMSGFEKFDKFDEAFDCFKSEGGY